MLHLCSHSLIFHLIIYIHCCHFIVYSVQGTAKLAPENTVMEFEAKSGRDGAWSIFPL